MHRGKNKSAGLSRSRPRQVNRHAMQGCIKKPSRRPHTVARSAFQIVPNPASGEFLDLRICHALFEQREYGKRENTRGLIAANPIQKNRLSCRTRRHKLVACVVTVTAAKQGIGSRVPACAADRPDRAGFNSANERSAKHQTETIVGKQDGRSAPGAVEAAMRNLCFDQGSRRSRSSGLIEGNLFMFGCLGRFLIRRRKRRKMFAHNA